MPGARVAGSFAFAREVLRSGAMRQAGADADAGKKDDPSQRSVFFLDGEPHRRRRAAIARFFTPKAISTRYREVMERTTDELLASMRAQGGAMLDRSSFQLAVAVAAEIVGLTQSDQIGMAARIRATLPSGGLRKWGPVGRLVAAATQRYHGLSFFLRDVRPAIAARREKRRDDVISHLLDEGYSDQAILIECMTYAVAGMVTTREFIVMAAWHLFERDALRERFLNGGEDEQFAILEEILRLEPVAAMLHRRAAEETQLAAAGSIAAGSVVAIDIRAANTDEAVTGPCPHMIDPDRARRMKVLGSYMSFGDGNHRCPGAQVAMHETRVFLDRLLRVPGIRLERAPEMRWFDELMSYELRNAKVVCDRS
ncbi:putative cytochrome P450 [Cystobacter fuscus DSM 2262]|uniref:Cytochrome P450 n=1 Tax=Cystobacter fuscus (strain ATCC 25194 / DSM 2262 / NBRC 100088 / M29) TaxID=1242864 RepID=S9QAA8_CYSF2|nr:putative cytochrome P450 [Cystobacter fuscus DSM 2262]